MMAWHFETELSQVIPRTSSIRSFRFPIGAKGVRYRAGQFFFITILVDGQEADHHFSFSSSPTEKGYLEFSKRVTGSAFSQTLAKIEPGAWARIRGPLGGFVLPAKPQKLAFLSGGIGITPLRSMMRYAGDRGIPHDIVLLYGNPSLEETAFREELEATQGLPGPAIRIEYVLSGPGIPADWRGRTGFINSQIVTEVMPDYRERLFYVSGPPRMVLALKEQLEALEIPPGRIRLDSFTGYD